MARHQQSEPEKVDYGHPSEDSSDRFPEDQLLRSHGFKIHSRPTYGEPVWLSSDLPPRLLKHSIAIFKVRTYLDRRKV